MDRSSRQKKKKKNQPLGRHTHPKNIYLLPIRDHLRYKDTYRLKVRRWEKVFHANGNQKKAGVAILIPDKIDIKTKTVTRDKEGHSLQFSLVAQSGPTLCDSMNCNPLGSSAHGIFQARILEWGAFPTPEDLPDPEIEH